MTMSCHILDNMWCIFQYGFSSSFCRRRNVWTERERHLFRWRCTRKGTAAHRGVLVFVGSKMLTCRSCTFHLEGTVCRFESSQYLPQRILSSRELVNLHLTTDTKIHVFMFILIYNRPFTVLLPATESVWGSLYMHGILSTERIFAEGYVCRCKVRKIANRFDKRYVLRETKYRYVRFLVV